MSRLLLIILAAFAVSSRAAIDLTPSASEYTAEGIAFRQLSFKDGKRRVIYELPRQWNYRGEGTSLQLLPPNSARADASIQSADAPKPQPFDEKLFGALREQSLHAAPPGAQSVSVLNEELNPVRLDRGDAYAVTISYQTLGETFVRSTLYVLFSDAQLTFRLTSRKADFERLNRAFRSSILSWHWVEDNAPTVAENAAIQTVATPRQ
ncbi:MAG: hypothetical protein QOI07_2780 [Verrucomicrobiota bacterium]|jgi:hypothetical protein